MDRIGKFFAPGRLSAYDVRAELWDEATNVTREYIPETAALIHVALEAQLDRARASVKGHDDKASLVLPGVGAIAGIIGTNVSLGALHNPFMVALLLSVFVTAAASVLLALWTMAPIWAHSSGPLPKALVLGTGDDPVVARVRLIDALGFAVETTEQVANAKAFWLAASLRVAGLSVLALLLFVLLGGMSR